MDLVSEFWDDCELTTLTYTLVSSGRDARVSFSALSISLALPSKKRPQPKYPSVPLAIGITIKPMLTADE
jgi:hypothetical protein